jgi:asparagine synthase (glutamine-hydrolysing)
VFGSEIKVILAYPAVRAEFERAGLPEYLAFGYLSGEETLYQGIRKLMPGHTMEIGPDSKLRIDAYWDLSVAGDDSSHDESYYVQNYRELLEQAVNSHLMSDVPLGVFLSGGVDSSADRQWKHFRSAMQSRPIANCHTRALSLNI